MQVRARLSSPRLQRRLARGALAAVAVGTLVAAVLLLPTGQEWRDALRPGPATVATPKPLRLTSADRLAIDHTVSRFVSAAVARRDLAEAYRLATPALRAGASPSDWRRGDIPVFPYRPRNRSFRHWTLNYAEGNLVNVDLLLQAREGAEVGDVVYTFDLRRIRGRWLVDSAVPIATYAPARKAPTIKASPDFSPAAGRSSGAERGGRLGPAWLLLPAGLLSLVVLVPVGVGIARWRRSARAYRRGIAPQQRP